MIDFDDADDMTFGAALVGGAGGLILMIVAIAFFLMASDNAADCAKKSCPSGQTPRLMDHDCLCAEKVR